MNNKIKLAFVILISLALTSCSLSKRPKMAYDTKDGGAVQEIESFNVKASAENFRNEAKNFSDDTRDILNKNKTEQNLVRRISLTDNSENQKKSLKLIDRNLKIKKLDNTEVSLKLDGMSIRSALKLFASLVQRNIILGDDVREDLTVTIDFENIKWGSAVYAILDINGLIMTEDEDSGLLRVHTKEVFAELEKSKIDNTIEINNNIASLEIGGSVSGSDGETEEPLITEVFKIFYQNSSDLVDSLSEIMGDAEGMTFIDDEKNNQLVITGTYAQLNQAEKVLNRIDLEKKQIMIEAYIVNATDGFNKNFNANLRAFNAAEVQAGRDRITYVGMGSNPSSTVQFTPTDGSSEGMTNAGLTSDVANIAGGLVMFGNVGMNKLRAVITSSVNDSNTETVSNPKLFAMDGEEATLTQGTTLVKVIPASGDAAGSTEEIPQNLSITVTPEIIGEKVKMELTLSNDTPGASLADGSVTTNEESITSIVQLNSGDVAVLGGVYKNTREDSKNYVPFFSKIPFLGMFFKQKTEQDNKTQLLIFLSANIV